MLHYASRSFHSTVPPQDIETGAFSGLEDVGLLRLESLNTPELRRGTFQWVSNRAETFLLGQRGGPIGSVRNQTFSELVEAGARHLLNWSKLGADIF